MKRFNSKILICLAIGMIFANCSCLFVDAETTRSISPKENITQAKFKNILRRVGTTKATIIKEFELPNGQVTEEDIYNASSFIGITSTNGEVSTQTLNTGCFKNSEGTYVASAFKLKVESIDSLNGNVKELKMVAAPSDNIDGEHFKVTSCKTEKIQNVDQKMVLKITWEIEGYDLDSCTEIMLPRFWATQKDGNSDKTE